MLTMLTMLTQWPLELPQRPSGLALCRSLQDLDWEAIFVDDDSRDGTPDAVSGLGNQDRRVFALNRLTATSLRPPASKECWRAARLMVAVMDADPQHKRLLSRMLD